MDIYGIANNGRSDLLETLLKDANITSATQQEGDSQNGTDTSSKLEIFSKDIKLKWEYEDGEVMPYGWFEPSNANEVENIPLIVWLHGGGEDNAGEDKLKSVGLPGIISNETLNGFCAYVLCPHLNNSGLDSWWDDEAPDKLEAVIEEFKEKKENIDGNNIILVGHSNGGIGTFVMAKERPKYFTKYVSISGVAPKDVGWKFELSEIADKTIYCYVGGLEGLDKGDGSKYFGQDSKNAFDGPIIKAFGQENCFKLEGKTHGEAPGAAFLLDNGHLRNS